MVKGWAPDYKHAYPEEKKRAWEREERKKARAELLKMKKAIFSEQDAGNASKLSTSIPETPIGFCFPGQGSQVNDL